ncbi:MAG: methyltransferase domain-containing protein [Saprospiraceae bacterium]|nr:methyltransferase domain-containing protein [Lewinella sp.]
MKINKHIERGAGAAKIFDSRSLAVDYRTLTPILRPGMQVLDVGCGTGGISKDIAGVVGPAGQVTGIDNTALFIESGKKTYADIQNLQLIHADLFDFNPDQDFDLIVSARVLQWLSDPLAALIKMKSLLKPGGMVSILDYNHEALEWEPQPPQSMLQFYDTFLRWRADAGMNNHIAKDLPKLLETAGFVEIETINSDERYDSSRADYKKKIGIWAEVAGSTQMVKEGYLDDALRLQAIREYTEWMEHSAVSMTMKLREVRGVS